MAAPLEESVEFFVTVVFENETLTVERKREFVLQAMLSLAGVIEGTSRWGQSMRIRQLGQEAAQKRKKPKLDDDKINRILQALVNSELSKDQALDYLASVFRDYGRDPRIIDEALGRVLQGDFRYASGSFSNWAKPVLKDK